MTEEDLAAVFVEKYVSYIAAATSSGPVSFLAAAAATGLAIAAMIKADAVAESQAFKDAVAANFPEGIA